MEQIKTVVPRIFNGSHGYNRSRDNSDYMTRSFLLVAVVRLNSLDSVFVIFPFEILVLPCKIKLRIKSYNFTDVRLYPVNS